MSENTGNGSLQVVSKEEKAVESIAKGKTAKKAIKTGNIASIGQVMTETDTKERDLSWVGLTKHLLTLKSVQSHLQGKGCKGQYEDLHFQVHKDKDGVHVVYLCHRENAIEKGKRIYRHYVVKGNAKPTWTRTEQKTF